MATLKLGPLGEAVIGKAGNTVFYRGRGGVLLRDYIIPENPSTELQSRARSAFTWAVATWNTLTPDQAQAWRNYAMTLSTREPGSGAVRAPRARDVFTRLAIKLRQVDPTRPIPLYPPPGRFFGDSVIVSALQESEGGVMFEADAPNRTGIVTELLLQPLRLPGSPAYPSKYRTQGFVAFDEEPVVVAASPGFYAAAYRFVNEATGQATELAELGMIQVM
ncbi:MAG: hypothetical protein KIT74_10750 [Fimbriimonadales bacterium]|nr:hypothetical protein [Fimbriimonadales bacterium]